MSVIKIKGNLLDMAENGKFNVIAHGCNCFQTMGAGIALQIAKKYPRALEADINFRKLVSHDIDLLGNNSYSLDKDLTIANCYTQYRPGANFDPYAFKICMLKLRDNFKKGTIIGIPEIGCGIGGGSRIHIYKILKDVFYYTDIVVVIYKP